MTKSYVFLNPCIGIYSYQPLRDKKKVLEIRKRVRNELKACGYSFPLKTFKIKAVAK